MRSIQALTYDVDEIDVAIEELRAGIDTSLFLKNTCGIVFCGFEPDMEALIDGLNKAFDFPFFHKRLFSEQYIAACADGG